jgi:competence protein ComEA
VIKNKDKIIGSMVILAACSIFFLFGIFNSNHGSYDEEDIFVESNLQDHSNLKEESKSKEIKKEIKVQIKGEVLHPGVFTLEADSRVEDLIKYAGGFTAEADKDRVISLAKKLRDEECIIIPKIGEDVSNLHANINNVTEESNENEIINVNTATKEELMELPGIGETIAQNIIDYREKNGEFNNEEDLKNVDRIGDKMIEKIKEKIEF